MDTLLRMDRLAEFKRKLEQLENDSLVLERARERFNRRPPAPRSSGVTTQYPSPDRRTKEERRLQRRRAQLYKEHAASLPNSQFCAEAIEDIKSGFSFHGDAHEKVRKRWKEQGIWNDRWDMFAHGAWNHEPLDLQPPSEKPSTIESWRGFKPRSTNGEGLMQQQLTTESRLLQEQQREYSRPYYQFIYQISKERERIEEESARKGGSAIIHDINTIAYENVKGRWLKRLIWDKRWGVLPGMSWKHEEPIDLTASPLLDPNPSPSPAPLDEQHSPARTFRSVSPPLSDRSKSIEVIPPAGTPISPIPSVKSTIEHQPKLEQTAPRRSQRIPQQRSPKATASKATTGPPKRTTRKAAGGNRKSSGPQTTQKKKPGKPPRGGRRKK
ncbi:hypothetical protein FQN55_000933 [Onygenales sp. PD_40]|nr:hypothetical protein FQN55_000933 [Onygenales sp. PD_40]KAK2775938.1 hypothetical protein FQN53_002926 [Emmonsiellopsis sp. PD_33]KAK2789370.1 hypothetical protein FQN52_006234 [Onygenales sp. PD_12]KAK2800290.1 hypothetical protein FQN51_006198 [Onygenales sp. PD_10]